MCLDFSRLFPKQAAWDWFEGPEARRCTIKPTNSLVEDMDIIPKTHGVEVPCIMRAVEGEN